jgi:ribose transport system ATP-binding protein
MPVRLSVQGISKRYGATVALSNVAIAVEPGEVHALIGENGAGKSTLLGVLAGAVQPDSGAMMFDGALYAPSNPHDARSRGIALIHQELSLCPHLSVLDNVLLGAEVANRGWIDRTRARSRALEILSELPHPEVQPERLVRDLSLPARQIVEVCRALAADVRMVLMDEPTSSLQGPDVSRLFVLIQKLSARGVAVLYISHFLEEVRQIASRYTVLRDGQSVSSGKLSDISNAGLISEMVGRAKSTLFPERARPVASAPVV